MAVSVVLVVLGLGLLAKAPDWFVLGAATLARRLGLSTVVVGAVVIGFGTSAPELLVSSLAAAGGEAEIGMGNVIGSNIANLTLILGIAGLFAPLAMPTGVIRREMPLALGATLIFAYFAGNGLTRVEGIVLFGLLVVALFTIIRGGRMIPEDDELVEETEEFLTEESTRPTWRVWTDLVMGLVGTVAGAQLLVTGAVDIADRAGLSGGFVGLTLVAIGTSLPELVTSVAAARQGEDQLIIGNLLGSNLFNSLAVGGAIGLVGPAVITDTSLTVTAVILMLVTTALGLAAMMFGRKIRKPEAVILILAWVATLPLIA